jgi:hypothetical protein
MENGKRVGGTAVGRAVFVFGENEEKSSTQSALRTQRTLRKSGEVCGVRS